MFLFLLINDDQLILWQILMNVEVIPAMNMGSAKIFKAVSTVLAKRDTRAMG